MTWKGERSRHSLSARGVTSTFNKQTRIIKQLKEERESLKWAQDVALGKQQQAIADEIHKLDSWWEVPIHRITFEEKWYQDGVDFNRFRVPVVVGYRHTNFGIYSPSEEDLESTEGFDYHISHSKGERELWISGDINHFDDILKMVKEEYK